MHQFYMSSGCGLGWNWMVRLGRKAKRRMGRVKGASEDLACRRGLGCWKELEGLLATRSAVVD